MKYIRIKDAEQHLPGGWRQCERVSVAVGSRQRGWKVGHNFRIGNYIYHFSGGEIYYAAQKLARG